MWANYFAAAWRNLVRDRLYAIVNVVGLAIGLTAAIVSGLFAHSELTFERFLPGYEHIYRISSGFAAPGSAMNPVDTTLPDLAPWLVSHLPAVQPIARLHLGTDAGVRVGQVEITAPIYWADPAFFDIFRLPVVAGDSLRALDRPDGVVVTQSVARRFFGRDDVIGNTLELDRKHTLRIAAVIQDLPANTHLRFDIVASARAQFSPVASADSLPINVSKPWNTHTYFRLQDGVSIESVRAALNTFILERQRQMGKGNEMQLFVPVAPISAIHLQGSGAAAMKSGGSIEMIYAICAVGLLILFVSVINFVNLSTARSTRRRVEVAVRKAVGATRAQLIVQFVGEAVLYAALGATLAACLVELVLPLFNKLSGSNLSFDYWHKPLLVAWIVALTLLTGLLAGAYPAFVLGSIRPVTALKGGPLQSGRAVRSLLVTAQFAVLIGLLCAIAVIFEQTSLARRAVSRLDTHNVFAITGACGSFTADVFAALPGVVAAACSESAPFGFVKRQSYGAVRGAIKTFYRKEVVDFGFFELYGVKPLAGRLFSRAHADDSGAVVINTTAARSFGFSSVAAAVGQYVTVLNESRAAQIVGVVPDFPLESVRSPIEATVFSIDRSAFQILSVRTSEAHQERTLESIRMLWNKLQPFRPVDLFPVDQGLRGRYADLIADGAVFGACSAVALLLACTGMFGLASFVVARRTKEVGIRKAMGADRADILGLLIGQLTRPVLVANLVAWPVCYFILRHWLSGFAYHVDLGPEVFLGAGVAAVLVAWGTIFAHALRLARAKPVTSLRYE